MFPRIDTGPIEYLLSISRAYNKDEQRECIRFSFATTAEFTYFQYHISIEEQAGNGELEFFLKGLKTSGLIMPGSGRAESSVDLFDLQGEYSVAVYKPGDVKNSFNLKVGKSKMKLTGNINEDDSYLSVSID